MRFAYLGRFKENDDATSIRVKNIGRILNMAGHSVDYICQEGFGDNVSKDGFNYYFSNVEKPKIKVFVEWITGKNAFQKFLNLNSANKYDAVVLYNVTSVFAKRVLKYCRKKNIKVIGDVTEWYEVKGCHKAGVRLFRKLVENRITKIDQKMDGIISISHYLTDYYQKKSIPVVEIPPVFEYVPERNSNTKNDNPVVIYAGNPSDKDELDVIFNALRIVNAEGIVINVDFVGTKKPINAENLEKIGIFFFPRCTNIEVVRMISKADYTVLFRKKKRFAMAGYSTKCAESLYNGIPVICNEVGGADIDIVNGETGIKIENLTEKAVVEGFRIAAYTDTEKRNEMKRKCCYFGGNKYYYGSYVKTMQMFLKRLNLK